MRLRTKFLAAVLVLSQAVPAPVAAWTLLPEPPASGFVMNLDLSTTSFQSIGYGLTSWSKLAESALAKWNAAGIGSGPDFGFFRIADPVVTGNACWPRDGINEVRWASDFCGSGWGDAIAITNRWIVNGARVEEDVIFNSTAPFNAYQGPLVRAANSTEMLNDFFRVAEHEFGHVAGLDHPNEAGQSVTAVMNSRISNIDSLQPDDIAGAHAIKWTGTSAMTTTTVTSTSSTTTTTLAAPGTINMQNYFPFRPGYAWTYQDEKPGSVLPLPYTRVVGQAPVTINGVPTFVWADSNGVSRYMTNDAEGIRRHANGSPGYAAGVGSITLTSIYTPPELYVPAAVALGTTLTQTGTITQTGSDGSSSTDTYSQTITFGAESVIVPAGTFATIRVSNLRVISGAASTNTFWVADGVGMVKLAFEDSSGATETFSLSSINFTPAPGPATMTLLPGWNLAGNSSSGTLDVAAAFGSPDILSVWKWSAGGTKWAFYAPSLAAPALADYASSKGYDVLAAVNGGEGFWVNAKTQYAAQLPAGTPVASASFQSLAPGWSLIAIGDGKTPREFNSAIGPNASPPEPDLASLWAWDASKSGWYFYAPGLDAQGTLGTYIGDKGYLDFGTKVLDPVSGFWVDRP